MSHVVTVEPEPFSACGGAIEVRAVPSASDNLVWLAIATATNEALVVDGPTAAEVIEVIDRLGARLSAVWITHGHGDHVGVLASLAKLGRLEGVEVVASADTALPVPATRLVDDGDTVRFAGLQARVLRTEGHMAGHVSYLLGDVLFCGDTMFAAGCGRPFHDVGALHGSLERLAALPPDTRICCAHEYTLSNLRFAWWADPGNTALAERIRRVRAERAAGRTVVPSTLGEELATNPFLRAGDPAVAARVGGGGRAEVFAALRGAKDRGVGVSEDELPS
ncbi:MAG: hydroxyacylglutathione hydrolase [Alphaproteobacteria bacterium]|nr:hydroxyacylglutathione hydrolase [Alphaproteobacteria bacterium]